MIISKYSEQCHRGLLEKISAKICLLKVFLRGQPEKAVRIYVVFSSHSIVTSEFFDMLYVLSYTWYTYAGTIESTGKMDSAGEFIISGIKRTEGFIFLHLSSAITEMR